MCSDKITVITAIIIVNRYQNRQRKNYAKVYIQYLRGLQFTDSFTILEQSPRLFCPLSYLALKLACSTHLSYHMHDQRLFISSTLQSTDWLFFGLLLLFCFTYMFHL